MLSIVLPFAALRTAESEHYFRGKREAGTLVKTLKLLLLQNGTKLCSSAMLSSCILHREDNSVPLSSLPSKQSQCLVGRLSQNWHWSCHSQLWERKIGSAALGRDTSVVVFSVSASLGNKRKAPHRYLHNTYAKNIVVQ